MTGPIVGMLGKAVGAMLASQVGPGLGALAGEVLSASDVGLPARRARQGRAGDGERQGLRERARRQRGGRPAVPRPPRGRAPAAVRPRAVAARAPARRRRRLRPRHRGQHRQPPELAGGEDARHRHEQPRLHARADGGRHVRHGEVARPAGRPGAARGHPRARRGLGRRGRQPGHRRADAQRHQARRRPYAAAARPAVRPRTPSPHWSASSCARAGSATPRRCGARCAPARASRPATASGWTRRCCRPPPTSTTRSASARARRHRRRCRRRTSTPRCARCSTATAVPAPTTSDERTRRHRRPEGVTLHDDALTTLRGWRGAVGGPGDVAGQVRRTPRGAPRRARAVLLPRPHHGRDAGAVGGRRRGAAQPAQEGPALVRTSAATASPATPRSPASPCARRARSPGSPDLDLHPEPVHLDEHVVGFCDPRGWCTTST